MAINRRDFIKKHHLDLRRANSFQEIESQLEAEYNVAWKHQKPKKDEWELRLKLYNNQKREKKAVGDTTLFTIHQTLLASLYIDRLIANWAGREEGDDEAAENLDALYKYDYEDMEKDVVDYIWDWDTIFFGRGLIDFSEYIREPDTNTYLPVPQNIDALLFLRDPWAHSINGNRLRRGAAKFFGNEVKMTRKDIEDHPHMFDDTEFSELKFGSGTASIMGDALQARTEAQGLQNVTKEEAEAKLGANAQYDVTQWQTHVELNGKIKKVKLWAANDRAKLIGMQVLDDDYWRVVDRPLYPTAHDWDGTSVPDLVEDKQRARAVAQNLGLDMMKADLYPSYIYDSNKIVNRKDLSFAFNKFIPMDGKGENLNTAIMPLLKSRPNMQLLDFIYASLDLSAQKATATPDIQQGIQSEKDRPLGETNLIASKVDTRYSLGAKVFGWSEKRFARMWYQSYKDNFADDIDEKTIRLVGAFGPDFRKLTRKNIITHIDPDVTIESDVVSRAKQLEERQSLSSYYGLALQEPGADRRYGLKQLGKSYGLTKDKIDRLFPPTVDERIAEDENKELNKDKMVRITAEDDHNTHLVIHSKAADTPASHAHIEAHKKALSIKKVQPELFPQDPTQTPLEPQEGEPRLARAIQPSQTSGQMTPQVTQ